MLLKKKWRDAYPDGFNWPRFWENVTKYAREKLSNLYVKKHGTDFRCPICKTWGYETNGFADMVDCHETHEFMIICKKCGCASHWVNHGIVSATLDSEIFLKFQQESLERFKRFQQGE